jgi:hypothetical protein
VRTLPARFFEGRIPDKENDMAFTVRVKVLRHMTGDKEYKPGDHRMLEIADAERLASTGAVEIVSKPSNAPPAKQQPKQRGAKSASAPKNKAVKGAPANKGS